MGLLLVQTSRKDVDSSVAGKPIIRRTAVVTSPRPRLLMASEAGPESRGVVNRIDSA